MILALIKKIMDKTFGHWWKHYPGKTKYVACRWCGKLPKSQWAECDRIVKGKQITFSDMQWLTAILGLALLAVTLLVVGLILCWAFGFTLNHRQITQMQDAAGSSQQKKTQVSTIIPLNPTQAKLVRFTVTAYCPCKKCCGAYADGVTASGHVIKAGDRFVAADCKFPFGTRMIVPGYNNSKAVTVLDRGGAIIGNHIDVFFDTHAEALKWGRQKLEIKIEGKKWTGTNTEKRGRQGG